MTREEAGKLQGVAAILTTGVLVLIALYGICEDGVREVIRWTARTSLFCLCGALVTDRMGSWSDSSCWSWAFVWPHRCRRRDDPRL